MFIWFIYSIQVLIDLTPILQYTISPQSSPESTVVHPHLRIQTQSFRSHHNDNTEILEPRRKHFANKLNDRSFFGNSSENTLPE